MSGFLRVAGRDRTQVVMAALCSIYTLAYVSFFYVLQDAAEIAERSLNGYLEVVLLGVPAVLLLAAVMWLRETEVDDDLRPRVVGWTLAISLLFLVAMWTALFVIETRFDPGEQWLILLLSLGFGASAGAVTGIQSIRSKQRERERRRSLAAARRTERERNQLEHLNQYLRHEVLNEANKISGYADLLADRTDPGTREADFLETITRSSRDIATFIESIRRILDAADHDPELAPVDLMATVRSVAAEIERGEAEVRVAVSGPETAHVLAGDLLERVFRNLIGNAIEHNRADVSVSIAVEAGEEWVSARVRDDGAGIPSEYREDLFEPPDSGDHGYGLFLTRNLVEVYGGRLTLAETGPQGTEFVARLPAASTASRSPATERSTRPKQPAR